MAASIASAAASKITSAAENAIEHPYYPLGVELAGYIANDLSVPGMVVGFGLGCGLLAMTARYLAKSYRPYISTVDVSALMWFIVTGSIHLFFEGYFAYHGAHIQGMSTLFGQMWKEYALSDSRYLTRDAFVLCMESSTAILWGPLSFVIVWMILRDHPLRHPLQIIVCMGQMYGLLLYYATSVFDHYILERTYFRPEGYYFWFYFIGLNFIWVVIPGVILFDSVTKTGQAFAANKKMNHNKKSR